MFVYLNLCGCVCTFRTICHAKTIHCCMMKFAPPNISLIFIAIMLATATGKPVSEKQHSRIVKHSVQSQSTHQRRVARSPSEKMSQPRAGSASISLTSSTKQNDTKVITLSIEELKSKAAMTTPEPVQPVHKKRSVKKQRVIKSSISLSKANTGAFISFN